MHLRLDRGLNREPSTSSFFCGEIGSDLVLHLTMQVLTSPNNRFYHYATRWFDVLRIRNDSMYISYFWRDVFDSQRAHMLPLSQG